MLWKVTAIARCRISREIVGGGRPRDERINTITNPLFKDCDTPAKVEEAYHAFWNDLNPKSEHIVTVVNVTEIFTK